MLIRDFANPNKKAWTEAEVIQRFGEYHCTCKMQNGYQRNCNVEQMLTRSQSQHPMHHHEPSTGLGIAVRRETSTGTETCQTRSKAQQKLAKLFLMESRQDPPEYPPCPICEEESREYDMVECTVSQMDPL